MKTTSKIPEGPAAYERAVSAVLTALGDFQDGLTVDIPRLRRRLIAETGTFRRHVPSESVMTQARLLRTQLERLPAVVDALEKGDLEAAREAARHALFSSMCESLN